MGSRELAGYTSRRPHGRKKAAARGRRASSDRGMARGGGARRRGMARRGMARAGGGAAGLVLFFHARYLGIPTYFTDEPAGDARAHQLLADHAFSPAAAGSADNCACSSSWLLPPAAVTSWQMRTLGNGHAGVCWS